MSSPPPPPKNNPDGPLPPGWSKGYSKSQKRQYYFHAETKHTQWHFPTASEAADPIKAKRRAEVNKKRQEESLGTIVGDIQVTKPAAAKRARTSHAAAAVQSSSTTTTTTSLADSTNVAVIVPYRDLHPSQQRAQHLAKFVPHMDQFFASLKEKQLVSDYHLYIVEQSNDGRKFNRGKLLNIGFDTSRKSGRNHDVFIFHDVDLLPAPDLGAWYAKFPQVPIHIARVWDRYSNNPKYFGGVVSFSAADYKRINGYPNTFWGWGGEDDEMQKRLDKLHMKWTWPHEGSLVDLEDMSLTDKLDFLRSNKEWKCMVKWEALNEHDATWKTNGLADLHYSLLETTALSRHATKYTVDVQLNGSHWANAKCSVDYMGG